MMVTSTTSLESRSHLAASYARFSSDLQRDDGIPDQQRVCKEAAAKNGHTIRPEFQFSDEAVSGTKRHRTGLDALLQAAADRRIGTVYFFSLSRLARESVISMPLLKELVHVHKVRVISVSEGVDSDRDGWELIATLLSLQHESFIRDLGKSVFRGQEGAVMNGFSAGDYCFGFTSEPVPGSEEGRRGRHAKPRMQYAVDPNTAEWVKRIFRWFVVERRSIRWIVRALNRLGAPKDHRSTTKTWRHAYVLRLLQNTKYIGQWPWAQLRNTRNPLTGQVSQEARNEEESQKWTRHFPDLRIIDDETFQRAQELLARNREMYARNRRANGTFKPSPGNGRSGEPRHLLSGLVRCDECGSIFSVGGAHGNYLFCPRYKQGRCSCKTQLQRARAERMILDALGCRILEDASWRQAVLDELQAAWREQERQVPAELAHAERRLAEIERKIERLVDTIEDGAEEPELRQRLAARRRERTELATAVDRLKRVDDRRGPPPTAGWLDAQLAKLGETLNGTTPAAAHALRDLVDGQIVVREIRRDGRKRHSLQGRFAIRSRPIVSSLIGGDSLSGEMQTTDRSEEIVLDFVDPDPFVARSERAKVLYDQGMLQSQIAEELGVKRSYVTKLLRHWYESRGLTMPDGRSRRSQLAQKHREPPLFQRIAEAVMDLYGQNFLLTEIARRMDVDINTVKKALTYWHESRGLPVPDGRVRRKTLAQKTSRPRRTTNENATVSD